MDVWNEQGDFYYNFNFVTLGVGVLVLGLGQNAHC